MEAGEIVITAKNGTKVTYTITVGKIIVMEIEKLNPTNDRRYHYTAFTIQSSSNTELGRYKFGLQEASAAVPTVQELLDGDGIYRKVSATTASNSVVWALFI